MDETGTSILILDPVISFVPTDIDGDGIPDIVEKIPARTSKHSEQLVSQITDAIAKNAWSKAIPFDNDPEHSPMAIAVYQGNEDLDTASTIRSRFARYADALIKVRQAQEDQDGTLFVERPNNILREETYPIRIRPSRSNSKNHDAYLGNRTDNVVGHLHMISSLRLPNQTDFPNTANALCLMRNEAELVVQYDPLTELENPAVQWHGVFKPVSETDKHFRATEPSTHDSWNPSSAESEISNDLVRRALTSVRRKARDFLSEHKTVARGSQRSVRTVANSLRSFVPFGNSEETVPAPKSSRSSSGKNRQTKHVDNVQIVNNTALPNGSGQEIVVRLNTLDPNIKRIVAVSVAAVTADGNLPLDGNDLEVTWEKAGGSPTRGLSAQLTQHQDTTVTLKSRVPTVLEVTFRVEADA